MPPIRQVPTSIKDANIAGYLRELRAAIGKTADKVEQALKPKTYTVENPTTPTEPPVTPTLTDPSVVLTVSPTAPKPAEPFTLTVVVSGNSPTGKVRFLTGAAELTGSPAAMEAGQASITVTVAEKGSYTYVAEYGGDTRNRAATSNTLTVEVGVGTGDGTAPPAPTSLTATPDNWAINLAWTQPWTASEPLADYLATEIWARRNAFPAYNAGTTYEANRKVKYNGVVYNSLKQDNVGHTPSTSAEWWEATTLTEMAERKKVGEIAGLNYVFTGDGELLSPDEEWAFWVRNADIEGLFSDYYPNNSTGVEATTLVTPEKALALLAGSIRETQLYKDLGDVIGALKEQWTVKITDGNLVGGIGLGISSVSGTPTLDFGVRADRFYVASTESEYKKDLIPLEADDPADIVVMTYTYLGTFWAYFCVASVTGLAANQWFRLRDICASNGTTELAAYNDSFFIDHVGATGAETSFPGVTAGNQARIVFFKPGSLPVGYQRTTTEPLKTSRMIPPGAMPLIVTTSTRTYNGTTILPGVYINNAWILKATITEADIADGSITNAKIGNYICSPNFESSGGDPTDPAGDPGTDGWCINKNGDAVFNRVIVRSSNNMNTGTATVSDFGKTPGGNYSVSLSSSGTLLSGTKPSVPAGVRGRISVTANIAIFSDNPDWYGFIEFWASSSQGYTSYAAEYITADEIYATTSITVQDYSLYTGAITFDLEYAVTTLGGGSPNLFCHASFLLIESRR